MALEFPELRIVAGHIGHPWTTEMISLATKYPNVHIDTSAYTARRYPQELVEYLRGRGRHKVLFGSNYPMITAEKCLEHLDQLQLDEETTRLFLSERGQGLRARALTRPAMRSPASRTYRGAPTRDKRGNPWH